MSEQSIYKFEPGMVAKADSGECGIVVSVASVRQDELIVVTPSRDYARWLMRFVEPDLDHPGTRGLLLQQYRDRSGNDGATTILDDYGVWHVDPDPNDESRAYAGSGKTDGAAIRDALARLTNAEWFATGGADIVERVEPAPAAEPKPQPAPPTSLVVAHFTHDDHNRKHRVVIKRSSGRVDVEWYAGEDALGNARWNREHCDVADGTPWAEIVALAIVEHYEAERWAAVNELRNALTLRASRCQELIGRNGGGPEDAARLHAKASAYEHAAEIVVAEVMPRRGGLS